MALVRGGRERAAALDYARRALQAAPNLLSHCAMGIACRDLGLLAEASGHLRNAVKLAPDKADHRLTRTAIRSRTRPASRNGTART
jgi:tetratricopeptide (TPR) repeat protein